MARKPKELELDKALEDLDQDVQEYEDSHEEDDELCFEDRILEYDECHNEYSDDGDDW